MDQIRLAELLFPEIIEDIDHYERFYPPRALPDEACVTRIGPSPTGFVHLGNLYNALIGERLAHQSGGVLMLRIEDTDQKREVAGAVEAVIRAMAFFDIGFDEGATLDGERGAYGPYRQSRRRAVYHAVARQLVLRGRAYPCFATEDELAAMREAQAARKENFGVYGKYAPARDFSLEEIERRLQAGQAYVLRFRSMGDGEHDIRVLDAIRGELTMQENYQDFVLLKSDGLPTYHFAHVVDDHFMRTTHVVRGEEWLSTLPMHIELFDTLGWPRPLYCHTAVLEKIDGETRRKLSKRKDPELALEFYQAEGYAPAAVWEYLLTVLNSNYEEWRRDNPQLDCREFPFTTDKMSNSGALFDLDKLNDIAQNVIAAMPAAHVYDQLLAWCELYDAPFAALLKRDRAYGERIVGVGKHGDRPRKDIRSWRQAAGFLSFYYDETFRREDDYPPAITGELRQQILQAYLDGYDAADEQAQWFGKIRAVAERYNFALKPKEHLHNPGKYRGSIVDVSNVIRIALTGRLNSPDLYEIIAIIGERRMRERINAAMKA
ncbi:MAG: glutamate--tRNA ligase family protein [Bacillota bacterium]|nr:glutamate--tRNA ligase family protein [Bacillota bacterium]